MSRPASSARALRRAYDSSHMPGEARVQAATRPSAAASGPWAVLDGLGITPTARRLATGDTLFRQGQATQGLYVLEAGAVCLLRFTASGAMVPMHTARAGELFAEASLFAERYHCDAVARRESTVRLYPRAALRQAFAARPETAWRFTAELAQRLQAARQRLELRNIRSAGERITQFLRLHTDRSGAWQADGTLKQWAEELGLTHEALYRALAVLERERVIRRAGTAIELLAGRHRSAARP